MVYSKSNFQAKQRKALVRVGMQKNISILVPCFNESEGIKLTVEAIAAYMTANHSEKSFEILIVNDGSTDSTEEALRACSYQVPELRTIGYFPNRGRGYAIKYGIKNSIGDIVILLDADLSYDVQHIGQILEKFESVPQADVVVVSPYMKGGFVSGVPAFRLALSKIANWLLASFFSDQLSTVTCVVRGYRGDLIRTLPLYENGKELHVEILRALILIGANVIEIPGRLVWKNKKRRKTNLKIFGSAIDHLMYALLMRPARYLVRAGILLLVIGFWEALMMARIVVSGFQGTDQGWGRDLWVALANAYSYSPHTAIIAITALILSFQLLSFAGLVQIMKIHQEEKMRHLIGLYRKA